MSVHWKYDEPGIRFWQDEHSAHLDIREFLTAGGRPYAHIMSCVKQLRAGGVLVIHAPFEPTPLVAQLEKRGLRCECRAEAEDHWTLAVFA